MNLPLIVIEVFFSANQTMNEVPVSAILDTKVLIV
jgi:hypothetical protein